MTLSYNGIRATAKHILKHGSKKQRRKLLRAYSGKRLKRWWQTMAKIEEIPIAQSMIYEGLNKRIMKGGHHHRRNYCICNCCGRWIRKNKSRKIYGIVFCGVKCMDNYNLDAEIASALLGG